MMLGMDPVASNDKEDEALNNNSAAELLDARRRMMAAEPSPTPVHRTTTSWKGRNSSPTKSPRTEGTTEESFAGYAIEEVEVPVKKTESLPDVGWTTGSDDASTAMEAKSVASVVVVGQSTPDIKLIVAGVELSQKALAADELEREAKKEAEEKAKE